MSQYDFKIGDKINFLKDISYSYGPPPYTITSMEPIRHNGAPVAWIKDLRGAETWCYPEDYTLASPKCRNIPKEDI